MADTAEMIRKLCERPAADVRAEWAAHINPTFLQAMELTGVGRDFVRGQGARLWDAEGREYVDCLAGYGADVLGYNHPDVAAAVQAALGARLPHFVLISAEPLAAALATKLAKLAPGDLDTAFLCSSGSEGVDGALKLARAATRRSRLVSARGGYHGTTFGALSVTACAAHRGPFEPLLPGCARVRWGDAQAIERELRKRDVAAVILEPIQGEGGVQLPPPGYLAEVARLCKRYGTLLVLDEVETGLGRTGSMFACEAEGVEPDVMVLAKGLSGGLVPAGAYVTRHALWKRAYGSLDRYDIHCSTFRGGPLACAAALATLEVIERDGLCARAASLGARLGTLLGAATAGHSLVRAVRGRGLLWGIELAMPSEGVATDLCAQWLVLGLLERGVVTQVGTLAPGVVRIMPALTVDEADLERVARALGDVLATHSTGRLRSLVGSAGQMLTSQLGRLGARGG